MNSSNSTEDLLTFFYEPRRGFRHFSMKPIDIFLWILIDLSMHFSVTWWISWHAFRVSWTSQDFQTFVNVIHNKIIDILLLFVSLIFADTYSIVPSIWHRHGRSDHNTLRAIPSNGVQLENLKLDVSRSTYTIIESIKKFNEIDI